VLLASIDLSISMWSEPISKNLGLAKWDVLKSAGIDIYFLIRGLSRFLNEIDPSQRLTPHLSFNIFRLNTLTFFTFLPMITTVTYS
jgi:hypothetical protein